MLIAGVVLWSVAHLFSAVAPGIRAKLVSKLGLGPYKGLVAVDVVLALLLIVFGWKAATHTMLFIPPLVGSLIPSAAILLAVILFVASSTPNNLRRFIRHPQMTAVTLWGAGHLLTNGDSRSVILFGGLTIWAVLEMIFINRRDGLWRKPDPVPVSKDLVTALLAAGACALLIHFHASLFGVPAITG
jgi:uncharacterized membrane protein